MIKKPRPGEPKVALCNIYGASVNSDGTNTPHKFQIFKHETFINGWFKHILFRRKGFGRSIQRDNALSFLLMVPHNISNCEHHCKQTVNIVMYAKKSKMCKLITLYKGKLLIRLWKSNVHIAYP